MTSRPNRLLNKMPNKREEWKYNMGKKYIYIGGFIIIATCDTTDYRKFISTRAIKDCTHEMNARESPTTTTTTTILHMRYMMQHRVILDHTDSDLMQYFN